MDSEALILVMTERMALQRYSPNTIKAYKQYAQVFLQAMSDYSSLKKIPVLEIEGFINRMVTDNKISVSYQRSLVGAIKKLYELTLDEKVKLDYLYPKRNFSSLPKFFSKDEIKRIFDATDNHKHKTMLMTIYSCGLRLSELLDLKITDIRSADKFLQINKSKGNKDRVVSLPDRLMKFCVSITGIINPLCIFLKEQMAVDTVNVVSNWYSRKLWQKEKSTLLVQSIRCGIRMLHI